MLYPHLVHKIDEKFDTVEVIVVIARSNLTPQDFSWTGLPELSEGTYVPTPDIVENENVFRFSSLFDAQRFIAYWWVTYMRLQTGSRKDEVVNRFGDTAHFLISNKN